MKYIFALILFAFVNASSFAAEDVIITETSPLYPSQDASSQDIYIFPIKLVNGSYPRDLNQTAVRSYNLWVFAVVPNSALLQVIPSYAGLLSPDGVTTLRLDRNSGWVFFYGDVDVNAPPSPSRSFPDDNNLLVMSPPSTRANLASLPVVIGLNRQIFAGTRILMTASDNPSVDQGWREVFHSHNYIFFDITAHPFNPYPDN